MNGQSNDRTRRSPRPHEDLQPSLMNETRPRPSAPHTAAPRRSPERPLEPSLGAAPARAAHSAADRPRAAAPRTASSTARVTSSTPRTASSAPRAAAASAAGETRRVGSVQSRQRRAAAPKRPPEKKKKAFAPGAFFARITKPLDVFRKDETSTIIVNSLVCAAALVIVLALLTLAGPGIRMARARSLAAGGQADAADKMLDALEKEGYSAQKIAAARREVAEQLLRRGQYDEALSYAATLEGDGLDELMQRARYGQAGALYDRGDYAAAAQAFYQLGDYGDSASRYADARCALAVATFLAGDEDTARQLLLNTEGVGERIAAAALKVTGSQEQARTLLALDLFNPDSLDRLRQTLAQLNEARENTPVGRIAAGYRHTAGLRSDGLVLAAGDNSRGQCDVSGWNSVIQIAAGAYHTVGLRMDGTVLAAGDNSEGQCDVSSWTDIAAVSATAYGTLGLKKDGTVVMCGLHSDLVSGWHGVTAIAGGSYSAGCLYEQGAMLCTHKGAQLDMGTVLYDLSVCGPVSAGVLADGTLVSSYGRAPSWTGLVSVTASETGLLGITQDGRALSFTFHTGEDVVLPVEGTAIEAESSGTHTVVLTGDGRVFAFGLNDDGQCNVSEWRL